MELFTFFIIRSLATIQENIQPFYTEMLTQNNDSNISIKEGERSNFSFMQYFSKKKDRSEQDLREKNLRVLKESRLDVSRTLLIQYVKILTTLLEVRHANINERSIKSFPPCDTFINAFEEYMLLPQGSQEFSRMEDISMIDEQALNRRRTLRSAPIDQSQLRLSTNNLETVYVTVTLLQKKEYLFREQ
jgi:hypothetical protein